MENTEFHKLQTSWTFWFESGKHSEKSTSTTTIGEKIKLISTIEEFWGFYEAFPKISTILKGSDSHFFRENIRPTQDDEENKKGCRLLCTFDLNTEEQKNQIDEIWEKLLKFCIGELFEFRELLNGVSFLMRSQGKITIWLNSQKEEDFKKFVADFKKQFNLQIKFKCFNHSKPLQTPIDID